MSTNLSAVSHQTESDNVTELQVLMDEARSEDLRAELHETARREWLRKRRRLGELTPEQERALETLLLSVANRISHLLIQQMRRSITVKESQKDEPLIPSERISS